MKYVSYRVRVQFCSANVYNRAMSKRNTGVGSKKTSHPHKTKKRLAIKHERLEALSKKRKKSN